MHVHSYMKQISTPTDTTVKENGERSGKSSTHTNAYLINKC